MIKVFLRNQDSVHFLHDVISGDNIVIIRLEIKQNSQFDTIIKICDIDNFTCDVAFSINCIIKQRCKLEEIDNIFDWQSVKMTDCFFL